MGKTICNSCVRCRDWNCDGEKDLTSCQFYKRMTNFDKYFRFTTIEKAADMLCLQGCCDCSHLYSGKCNGDHNAMLDWLKQEVSDNG